MNAVTSASLDIRLQDLLRQMRLPTVSANYRKLASEAADSGQPYEEYLLALLEQEAAQREVNRRKRRIREARFPILHTLDEYDFSLMPKLSKPKILELARGDFIDKAENAVFVGTIGTGKTHLATAIGLAACEQGKRVRFFTAAEALPPLEPSPPADPRRALAAIRSQAGALADRLRLVHLLYREAEAALLDAEAADLPDGPASPVTTALARSLRQIGLDPAALLQASAASTDTPS